MTDIASARRAAGLTQQQAAELLGVARTTVSGWERGDAAPTPEQVAALSSGAEVPAPRGRGRQRAQDAAPRLVPCPVRVSPEAAAIARERGSAWLSALIEGRGDWTVERHAWGRRYRLGPVEVDALDGGAVMVRTVSALGTLPAAEAAEVYTEVAALCRRLSNYHPGASER